MSRDIVTRLRENGDCEVPMTSGVTFKAKFPIMLEAADEIERLRAEVAWWRDKAVDYAYDDEKCECDRCVAVRARHDSTN